MEHNYERLYKQSSNDKSQENPKRRKSNKKDRVLWKKKRKRPQRQRNPVVVTWNVTPYHDIKNGFLELDWNNEFIEQLDAGYKGETNEQIVDAWFKTIARNILEEQGL